MSIFKAKMKAVVGKAATSLIPIPIPEIYTGAGCIKDIGKLATSLGLRNILIVTDEILPTLGLLDSTYEALSAAGVAHVVYDKIIPDPTAELCVEGVRMYVEKKCDAIIAFGGGSSMDAAKFIAVLATASNPLDPALDPKKFTGTVPMSIFAKLPKLIAIPTTAGTGSETTFAAVISFPKDLKKFMVFDPRIVPSYAFLDPLLLKKLPKSITAATGMDALTHAVESFVSPWRTDFTMEKSLSAVKNIFEYLPECYENGENLEAREKVLVASFDAGLAFTRAGVGYVHAIAHQLGALFHIPHGVANAMLLHRMLEFYRTPPTNQFAVNALARLALAIQNKETEPVTDANRDALAKDFVLAVQKLTDAVEIPSFAKKFPVSMVPTVAQRAINEAHGQQFNFFEEPLKNLLDVGYPVPKYMTLEECEALITKIVDPDAPSHSHL